MGSNWENLPSHLLHLVLERLEILSNFIRFSVVCKSWLHVANDNRNLAETLARKQPPVLIIASDIEETWNVYTIMDHKVSKKKRNKVRAWQAELPTKLLGGAKLLGSSKGWLILVEKEDLSVTLVDALSGGRETNSSILLPPLHPRISGTTATFHDVNKAMISADPIADAEDCIVVVTYADQGQGKLSFIRPGKADTTWTHISTRIIREIEEVVYAGANKFYAVGNRSTLFSFDITTQTESNVTMKTSLVAPTAGVYIKRYLVKLDEKRLMMIHRYMRYSYTKKFKLFEMDFDNCRWVKMRTLGDGAIFLGNMSTLYISTLNLPKCQPNCIYFSHDDSYFADYYAGEYHINESHDDFGVYNVKSKHISKPFAKSSMSLVEKAHFPAFWIVPALKL